jgi:hypothetical protein
MGKDFFLKPALGIQAQSGEEVGEFWECSRMKAIDSYS